MECMTNKCALPLYQGVILISGATRSGKTYFVYKMLLNIKNQFYEPYPKSFFFGMQSINLYMTKL